MEETTKKIATLLLFVILIGSVSAMYPGETKIFNNEMGIENLVYAVVGNSSLINIGVEINSTNIIITFPQDMIPDNFQLVFIENNTVVQTITNTIHTGGGGGGIKYIYKNITQNIPIYTDFETIKEIPVEKIVKEIEYTETGYKLWHIILGIILTLVIALILLYLFKKDDNFYKREEQQ